MKKLFIFIVLIPFLNANSQIHVNSAGETTLNNHTTVEVSKWLHVGTNSYPNRLAFTSTSSNYNYIDYTGSKLYFRNYNGTSAPTRIFLQSNGNIRFYGRVGINMDPPSTTYHLDINGTARSFAWEVQSADIKLKDSIKNINTSKIYSLNGISFIRKQDVEIGNEGSETPKADIENDTTRADNDVYYSDNKLHYGFIAQELKDIYPEIISEDGNGIYSIDYIALIPILVEVLKEHKSYIDSLNTRLDEIEKAYDDKPEEKSTDPSSIEKIFYAWLGKNKPNPFNENTTIEYFLPSTVQKATLYIYDLQGKQIKSINLANREHGYVTISGFELQPGMYHYSLISDGNVIGTERMILTE